MQISPIHIGSRNSSKNKKNTFSNLDTSIKINSENKKHIVSVSQATEGMCHTRYMCIVLYRVFGINYQNFQFLTCRFVKRHTQKEK